MSEDLVTRVSASSGSRDDGTSGHLLQQLTGTVPSPSDFVSAPGEEAPSDRSSRGRRARAPRVVTNVSVLGEMHFYCRHVSKTSAAYYRRQIPSGARQRDLRCLRHIPNPWSCRNGSNGVQQDKLNVTV